MNAMKLAHELKRAGYSSSFAECLRDAHAHLAGRLFIILSADAVEAPAAATPIEDNSDAPEIELTEEDFVEVPGREWWLRQVEYAELVGWVAG